MKDVNDKVTDGTLTADEWNEIPSEMQNIIEGWGISLSSGDLNQLGKGVSAYAAAGQFYTGGGTANAHIATKLSGIQAPPAYATGMVVRFRPSNANTAAATINVDSIGVKSIKKEDGSALGPGDLETTRDAWIRYDGTDFLLSNWSATSNDLSEFAGYWERTNGSTYTLKPGIGGQIIINIDGARLVRTTDLIFDFGDLDTGSESASTAYYLYIDNIAGVMTPVISLEEPIDIGAGGKTGYGQTRTDERCVLGVWNNVSSDFPEATHMPDGRVRFERHDADHEHNLVEAASTSWVNLPVNIPETAISVSFNASAITPTAPGMVVWGKDGATGVLTANATNPITDNFEDAIFHASNGGSNDQNGYSISGEIPIVDRSTPAISYGITRTLPSDNHVCIVNGYHDWCAPKY